MPAAAVGEGRAPACCARCMQEHPARLYVAKVRHWPIGAEIPSALHTMPCVGLCTRLRHRRDSSDATAELLQDSSRPACVGGPCIWHRSGNYRPAARLRAARLSGGLLAERGCRTKVLSRTAHERPQIQREGQRRVLARRGTAWHSLCGYFTVDLPIYDIRRRPRRL